MNLKKKIWGVCFACFMLFPLLGKATMNLPKQIEFFDLEMPMRCQADDFKEQSLSSTVVIKPQDFTVRLPAQTEPLPRYQVNSFSSRKQPVEVAIQNLLSEADIQVLSEPGVYPVVSLKSLRGELSKVLEEIAQKAGIFYTYDSAQKTLTLKPKSQMIIQLPHNRQLVMAVVDALSGARLAPVTTDWEKYQISMTGTREELNKARHLMSSFIQDKYLISAQMSLYEMHPYNSISHWHQIIDDFGLSRFALSQPGTAGTLLVLKPALNVFQLVAKAMERYQVTPLARGQMVVPSGWRVNFKLGECAVNSPYENLSISLKSDIQSKKNAQNTLVIDSKQGEIASFDFANMMDQEVAVVGIPVPNKQNSELLLTLKFNFINLIKKGE
jgi:hypothetical protein